MIDLKVTEPYKSAIRAQIFLNDALLWLDTFEGNDQLQEVILDMIRQDQLFRRGVDGNEEVIGFYSFVTSLINPEKTFNTHYTLEDTGEFYQSMFITVLVDALEINADTVKMEDQEWWRDEILKLTETNLQQLRDVYRENAISYAKKVLLGSI